MVFKKGQKLSAETRLKISLALKGRTPKNFERIQKLSWEMSKGKKHTKEHKHKISKALVGIKRSDETKLKMSSVKLGNKNPAFGQGARQIGEKNPSWKGGITKLPTYTSFNNRRQKLKRRGAEGSHTLKQWEALKEKYNFMCLCCKQQEPFIKLTVDHIVPLIKGGSNYIENIQPLCMKCNMVKHTKSTNYISLLEIEYGIQR